MNKPAKEKRDKAKAACAGKTDFTTKRAAQMTANEINRFNEGKAVKFMSVYRCNVCTLYHLTSRELDRDQWKFPKVRR